MFCSVTEASDFFRHGSLGWSPRAAGDGLDGLELRCLEWQMAPLSVEHLESSFFQDRGVFHPGAVEFDSAFLMRRVPHEWHARGVLGVSPELAI